MDYRFSLKYTYINGIKGGNSLWIEEKCVILEAKTLLRYRRKMGLNETTLDYQQFKYRLCTYYYL